MDQEGMTTSTSRSSKLRTLTIILAICAFAIPVGLAVDSYVTYKDNKEYDQAMERVRLGCGPEIAYKFKVTHSRDYSGIAENDSYEWVMRCNVQR